MSTSEMRPFTFDTVFDASGRVLRDGDGARLYFEPEEVEAERQAAFAAGEASAVAQAEAAAAAALGHIAEHARQISERLGAESAQLKRDAAALGLAAARAAAETALAQFPQDAVEGFFREVAEFLRDQPRLVVRVGPDAGEAVEARLSPLAAQFGCGEALRVETDPAAAPGDCVIVWPEGSVARNTTDAFTAIEQAAKRWLAEAGADPGEQLTLFGS